jgi:hypothetical protein
MAISEREFYAAHGLDMSPDKLLQEYTKYTSAKMLEVVRSEIDEFQIGKLIGITAEEQEQFLNIIERIKQNFNE